MFWIHVYFYIFFLTEIMDSRFIEHEDDVASSSSGNTCDVCGKHFSTMSNLRRHMAIHSSDTSYPLFIYPLSIWGISFIMVDWFHCVHVVYCLDGRGRCLKVTNQKTERGFDWLPMRIQYTTETCKECFLNCPL